MNLYSLILDAIFLLLALWIVIAAYRRGFLRSALLSVGAVASVVAAVMLSTPAAQFCYDRFLEKPVSQAVMQAMENGGAELTDTVEGILNELPDMVKNPLLASLGGEEGLAEALLGTAQESSQTIMAELVAPIIISMLQALMCLLIFLICVIIVKILASAFHDFNRVPLLGPVNAALGAALGVVQAGVLLYLLALAVSLVVSLSADRLPWLNSGIIEHTYFFRLFYNIQLWK